jgi:hypothetical protein
LPRKPKCNYDNGLIYQFANGFLSSLKVTVDAAFETLAK